MVLATFSKRNWISKSPLKTKISLGKKQKKILDFIDSHSFSITENKYGKKQLKLIN